MVGDPLLTAAKGVGDTGPPGLVGEADAAAAAGDSEGDADAALVMEGGRALLLTEIEDVAVLPRDVDLDAVRDLDGVLDRDVDLVKDAVEVPVRVVDGDADTLKVGVVDGVTAVDGVPEQEP